MNLPLWMEARGSILDIDYTEDTVSIVLVFNKRVAFNIPRSLIVSMPPVLQNNEFISVLRHDGGYTIKILPNEEKKHHATADNSNRYDRNVVKSTLGGFDRE